MDPWKEELRLACGIEAELRLLLSCARCRASNQLTDRGTRTCAARGFVWVRDGNVASYMFVWLKVISLSEKSA